MKYDIDRPETVEFLAMIKRFWDDVGKREDRSLEQGHGGPGVGGLRGGQARHEHNLGHEPVSEWKLNPEQTYKYTWLPVSDARKGVKFAPIGGHASTIQKGSKNPDATFRLAEFITEKEACDIIFEKVAGWVHGSPIRIRLTSRLSRTHTGSHPLLYHNHA